MTISRNLLLRHKEKYGHNLNQWAKKWSKFQFFPSFIVKNNPENPHTWCGGFSCFNVLSSFSSLPFLALVFHLSLLLLDFLKPKSGPSNEVIGKKYMCIYIYIHTHMSAGLLQSEFWAKSAFWMGLVRGELCTARLAKVQGKPS